MKNPTQYYKKVDEYFSEDAADFEHRYRQNGILQDLRKSFRSYISRLDFDTALEIGFGPGLDLEYFANKFPMRKFYGVDIAKGMVDICEERLAREQIKNVQIAHSNIENISNCFPNVETYDVIYVFFGALNTVSDLNKVVKCLEILSHKETRLILTFVNKIYLAEIIIHLLRGRFSSALNRLNPVWGGYSPVKNLESRCYSFKDIKNAFGEYFCIEEKRGYSILSPPWFRSGLKQKLGPVYNLLFKLDEALSKTVCWQLGEYSLYTMKKS